MIFRTIAASACAVAVAACATQPPPLKRMGAAPWSVAQLVPPFAPEPTSHQTFEGKRGFAAGARLRFVSFTLGPQEQLRLERCGPQCATAKLVTSWNKADFDKSPAREIVLAEPGQYYLWLRSELSNGEVGAVQAAASTFDRENGVLRFESGTAVFVAIDGVGTPVDWPDSPVRVANENEHNADLALRKLESMAILEKSRHGVKQDLLVQFDPGEAAQALLQQTAPVPGEDLSLQPATVARRAQAWTAYQALLHEGKRKIVSQLPRADVELIPPDLDATPMFVISLSSETALRALLSAPQVTSVYENHRVVLN